MLASGRAVLLFQIFVAGSHSPETIDALKARGPGYTNFAEEVVLRALQVKDGNLTKRKTKPKRPKQRG